MSVAVGYTASPEGRAALGHAISQSTLRKAGMVIVVLAAVEGSAEFAADLSLARGSVGEGKVTVRAVASESDAVDELVDLSYEDTTDLLVIGLRRRSPVGKLVMGSSSQQILLSAHCPVTAVKAPVQPSEE